MIAQLAEGLNAVRFATGKRFCHQPPNQSWNQSARHFFDFQTKPLWCALAQNFPKVVWLAQFWFFSRKDVSELFQAWLLQWSASCNIERMDGSTKNQQKPLFPVKLTVAISETTPNLFCLRSLFVNHIARMLQVKSEKDQQKPLFVLS